MSEKPRKRPDCVENSAERLEKQRLEERCFLEQISGIKAGLDPDSLKTHVCDYIAERYRSDQQIVGFFIDLAHGGMSKGLVSDLTHTEQTQAFFDRFYGDIEKIRDKLDELGEPLVLKGDLKNDLAWLGFEETAKEIGEELLGVEARKIRVLNPADYSDEENLEFTVEEPSLLEKVRQLSAEAYPHSIYACVLRHIVKNCEDSDEVENFLNDAGFHSGLVERLVSHDDMEEFFDELYEDIKIVRRRIENLSGIGLSAEDRLKTFFAYLFFDEAAAKIAGEIGLGES